jgi:hypothetical protein
MVNGPVCRDFDNEFHLLTTRIIVQAIGSEGGENRCGETASFLWRGLNLQLSRKPFQPDFIYPRSHLTHVGTERFGETSREAWLQISTLRTGVSKPSAAVRLRPDGRLQNEHHFTPDSDYDLHL